jgi:hypothetical protein
MSPPASRGRPAGPHGRAFSPIVGQEHAAWRRRLNHDTLEFTTTRQAIHVLIDELDDDDLELAKQALEEIRDEGFELDDAEKRELSDREAECARGDKRDVRELLDEMRGEGTVDSNG